MTIQYKPVSGLNTTSLNKLIEISKKDLTTKVTTIETNLSELRANVNNSNSKVNTIETDLFNLIDSMYKSDDEDEIEED